MTLIVNQLETYDKSNLDVIRIEFAKLQKRLKECQEEQEFFKPDIGKTARGLWVVIGVIPHHFLKGMIFFQITFEKDHLFKMLSDK